MKNIKYLSDSKLLETTLKLSKKEREVTLEILEHLREVEYRRLYCKLGYSSLFSYCVSVLSYSESSANRRIQSMRLLKSLPEIQEKIEEGTLSLSTLTQAQSFFKEAEAQSDKTIPKEDKLKLLTELEGKTSREVERELADKRNPEIRPLEKDSLKPLNKEHRHSAP